MKFKVNKGPFLRNKRSTTSIMLELFAVLCIVWFVSIAFYATKYNIFAGIRVFAIGAVSILTTLIVDVIVALIKGKRNFVDICKFVLKSYSYVTAIIFALCLPAGTSFYVVILGALVASVIGKYVFGGFGNNIFNPAIIGRIFVGLSFSDKLKTIQVAKATNGIDLVNGATLTGSMNWQTGTSSFTGANKVNLLQTLFGEYQGAIGETFTILLVLAGIYLIVRGIVNYRLVLGYLLTATLCSLGVGLVNEVNDIGTYLLTSLSTGGLMFAAVFMITDPVTSPKSQDGKLIYSMIAGCLTIFIRVFSSYPEGVMFSIALANMITPLIDQSIKGNTFERIPSRTIKIASVALGAALITTGYALIPFDEAGNVASLPSKSEGGTVKVDTGVTKISDSLYRVKKAGFNGDITLDIRVDRYANKITSIKVVGNLPQHELYSKWTDETSDGYIGDNLNIDFSMFDAFTCSGTCTKTDSSLVDYDITSGATYTSSAVINGIKSVLKQISEETSLSFTKSGNVYRVTKEGFYSDTPIVVDFEVDGETIVKATLINSNAHEGYEGIANTSVYNKWFGDNLNITFEDIDNFVKSNDKYTNTGSNDLDLITDATYTSNAIVSAYKEVVDAVRGEA